MSTFLTMIFSNLFLQILEIIKVRVAFNFFAILATDKLRVGIVSENYVGLEDLKIAIRRRTIPQKLTVINKILQQLVFLPLHIEA